MLPALSQVCSLHAPFETDIADYAAGACRTIELWTGKLDGYLKQHTLDDARRLLAEHDVQAPVASFQGGLFIEPGAARDEHWSRFRERLSQCRPLGIATLVVAGDIHGPLTERDVERVRTSLAEAAEAAGAAGVRLAFEFQAPATLANNLESAASLVAEIGSPHLGLCFDVFHYYTGPSKFEDLGHLSPANLFHVQLCDLAGVARELASDADRILPGDGDFQLAPILDVLRQIGYAGCVSVELLNPQIWQIPPRSVGEIAITALRKLLGQASMG